MPDLSFEITSARVKPFNLVPTLEFQLHIVNDAGDEEVFAAALKCQVLIDATRRSYNQATRKNLREVFGNPERWEETVRALMWTTVTVPVPRFRGHTTLTVEIPSSEDHVTAAGKYFYSVKDDFIPLGFLFSGTIFYKEDSSDTLQIMQVPWHKEASFKMPAALWHEMIGIYFPGRRWLSLSNELFDRLYCYKSSGSFSTMEQCIESLLGEEILDNERAERQA